ncbi:MAG: hypothetical protein ACRCTQ_06335 [Brevinemataceae bacterium]
MKKILLLNLLFILGACSATPSSSTPQEQAISEAISEAKSRLPEIILQNTKEYKTNIVELYTSTLTNTCIQQYTINDRYLSRITIVYLNGTGIPSIANAGSTKDKWNDDIIIKTATYDTLRELPMPKIYKKDGSLYTVEQGSILYRSTQKQFEVWNSPDISSDKNAGKWGSVLNNEITYNLIKVTDTHLTILPVSESDGKYTIESTIGSIYNRI